MDVIKRVRVYRVPVGLGLFTLRFDMSGLVLGDRVRVRFVTMLPEPWSAAPKTRPKKLCSAFKCEGRCYKL